MTQFVIVIDASIVNVALPSIGRALHFSRDDLSWVVNAYTLTFGGFLLLGGRLADLLGRRRMASRSSPRSPTAAPRACCTPAYTTRRWP
jgi:MFS family permease